MWSLEQNGLLSWCLGLVDLRGSRQELRFFHWHVL